MSVDLQKQSLATLKEWAHLLGIRGVSNARKADLVDLLTRVGEKRVEYAMGLAAEKEKQAAEEAKNAPGAAAGETVSADKKTYSIRPNGTIRTGRPGRPPKADRYLRMENSAKPAEEKAEPAEKPEQPAAERPVPAPSPERRMTYRRSYESSFPRSSNRSGFGTYAPSYRAQAVAAESQDRLPRNLYEVPTLDQRAEEEERPNYRSDDDDFYGQRERNPESYRSRLPEEGSRSYRTPSYSQPQPQEDSISDKTDKNNYPEALAGPAAEGILEVMPDGNGYGFIRCENYMPGDNDVYVSPAQIHRFGLKTGDVLAGVTKVKTNTEKFPALLYINTVNGESPETVKARKPFEDLTPVFPHDRIHLETQTESLAMRIVDIMAPIGKGQRGMIVSPPKAGKTTLIKDVAKAVTKNHPDMQMIILLIDERPEEVTDIKEDIAGPNVEVIYSTFDETPEHHKRVAEMVLGRAQRLVEHGRDVIILLDSITRLARAYNLTVAPSGRTLSGGLDPAALHMPKKFFGAARCMREGGSLTVLATALVDTGSRMDDVVYEEFKGTGNMELVLDRKLSERRIFPAIDILKSGTRRDDLLLDAEEQETVSYIRRAISNPVKGEEALEKVLDLMKHTRTNREFCALVRKIRF